MAKTLLLGLGGTGSRIVNLVAKELRANGKGINDGQIACAVLDTDEGDQSRLRNDGTYIPVIGTCRDNKVAWYFNQYKDTVEWCPQSTSLKEENMMAGASQCRVKSRLAFKDTCATNKINELRSVVAPLFNQNDGEEAQVVIVSSISGGTGCGMFIQVALWLRNYLVSIQRSASIYGIFLLPDIFVHTVNTIKNDSSQTMKLRANAYGAIRDLNAITKIKTGDNTYNPLKPIKIDDLFDSDHVTEHSPVFNYAFLLDTTAIGGAELNTLEEYEQVSARIIYARAFSPMRGEILSTENNIQTARKESDEPVFDTCGTAKAVYPTESILEYCALRAVDDAISTGWRKIDISIEAKQKRENERVRNGEVVTSRIVPRYVFAQEYEENIAKTGAEIGRDRMFIDIKYDHCEEKRSKDDKTGRVNVEYIDRIDKVWWPGLINTINQFVENERCVGSTYCEIKLPKTWKESQEVTIDELKDCVSTKSRIVSNYIADVEEQANEFAMTALESIFSSDMGSVNKGNAASVYGLLTKKDEEGERNFVHPLAARYMLSKVLQKLESETAIDLDRLKEAAEGDLAEWDFDNKKTKKEESSIIEYLNSRTVFQGKKAFVKEFQEKYDIFCNAQSEACKKYAVALVQTALYPKLKERIEALLSLIEGFFKQLVDVSQNLKNAIFDNVNKESMPSQKIIYVAASKDDKEATYEALNLDVGTSSKQINEIILDSLYGKLCAKIQPEYEYNKKYLGKDIFSTFKENAVEAYRKQILEEKREEVDLNIYQAICKNSDRAVKDLTSESPQVRMQRHQQALERVVADIKHLSKPLLIWDASEGAGDLQTSIMSWGFHPEVAKACDLAHMFGIAVDRSQSEEYNKNEIVCLSATYNIKASQITKFNETKNGEYYASYQEVVDKMMQSDVVNGEPVRLDQTPHLDKTWHLFLPYISVQKQKAEESVFYKRFWLALGYKFVSLNRDKNFCFVRERRASEVILLDGQTISNMQIGKLLVALKFYGTFMQETDALEDLFKQDCQRAITGTYEGTGFFKGISAVSEDETISDCNAVAVIARYYNYAGAQRDENVMSGLISALEALMEELASAKYPVSATREIQSKAEELCGRVYGACRLTNLKNIEHLASWQKRSVKAKDETEE